MSLLKCAVCREDAFIYNKTAKTCGYCRGWLCRRCHEKSPACSLKCADAWDTRNALEWSLRWTGTVMGVDYSVSSDGTSYTVVKYTRGDGKRVEYKPLGFLVNPPGLGDRVVLPVPRFEGLQEVNPATTDTGEPRGTL